MVVHHHPLNIDRSRDNLTLLTRYLRRHLSQDDLPHLQPLVGRLCADHQHALDLLAHLSRLLNLEHRHQE